MLALIGWLILLVLCWPLALLALIPVANRVADFTAFPPGWHHVRGAFRAAKGDTISASPTAGPQA
jgi:hypothetical protein